MSVIRRLTRLEDRLAPRVEALTIVTLHRLAAGEDVALSARDAAIMAELAELAR